MAIRRLTLLACAGLSLAAPAVGSASTLSVSGAQVVYRASNGEANQVVIDPVAATFRVTDDGAVIGASAPCAVTAGSQGHVATCPSAGITLLDVSTANRDDELTFNGSTRLSANGGTGFNTLVGGSGNDTLVSAAGAQTDNMSGRGGNDVLNSTRASGSSLFTAVLDGGLGKDQVRAGSPNSDLLGGDGNDALVGGPGSDNLDGGIGVDNLSGGPADDSLRGGPGTDVLNGGDGPDVADFSDHGTAVTVKLDGVANDGSAGENEFVKADVEGAVGGTAGDTLIGNAGDNFLQGLDGGDTITGGNGEDSLCGDGQASSDSYYFVYCELYTGGGVDSLNGGNGDDVLSGGGAADVLDGGAGALGGVDTADFSSRFTDMTVTLDNVADDGDAGEGDNVKTTVENVLMGAGTDTVTASAADNYVVGGGGVDTLNGGDGSDRLCGEFGFLAFFPSAPGFCSSFPGGGTNTLNGGTGDDEMGGGLEADVFNGGTGNDTADLSDHDTDLTVTLDGTADDGSGAEGDNVKADVENVIGGSGSDTLTGSALPNVLMGGDGTLDTLNGADGNDVLAGGKGADVINGGNNFDFATYQGDCRIQFQCPGGTNVTVTINGVADDGHATEGDNVKGTVEGVIGDSGNDTLTGNALANSLIGLAGNDTLNGLALGDNLVGGPGTDTANGSTGADRINSRDGAAGDVDNCGADSDTVTQDATDTTDGQCETVTPAHASRGRTLAADPQSAAFRRLMRRAAGLRRPAPGPLSSSG